MHLKEELLKVEDLRVHFRYRNIRAVDGVDFVVYCGEKFTLIGESGSGKSVLATSILRLLPKDAEVYGKIIFDGINLLELNEEEMRKIRGRRIALIPQSQSALNPVLTVGFQCSEPIIEHFKVDKKSALNKILKIFDFLGIGRRINDYPHQFSGGMKQRVLVAMGISANPDLIIADEPTKGLDVSKRKQVIELFRKIDKTMLIITHDLHFANAIATRIGVMYAGKIVEICKAKEFFKEPLHPYSQGLLNSLPSRGLKPIKGVTSINPVQGCRFRERCDFAWEKCKTEPPLLNVNGRLVRCWLFDPT